MATRYGLDADLLEAQVLVESFRPHTDAFRFEPGIWSQLQRGALHPAIPIDLTTANPRRIASSYGLLQILYVTALDRGYRGDPEGLFVPEVGLSFGCGRAEGIPDVGQGRHRVRAGGVQRRRARQRPRRRDETQSSLRRPSDRGEGRAAERETGRMTCHRLPILLALLLTAAPAFAQLPESGADAGATRAVTLHAICTPGSSGKAAAVSASTKRAVFAPAIT